MLVCPIKSLYHPPLLQPPGLVLETPRGQTRRIVPRRLLLRLVNNPLNPPSETLLCNLPHVPVNLPRMSTQVRHLALWLPRKETMRPPVATIPLKKGMLLLIPLGPPVLPHGPLTNLPIPLPSRPTLAGLLPKRTRPSSPTSMIIKPSPPILILPPPRLPGIGGGKCSVRFPLALTDAATRKKTSNTKVTLVEDDLPTFGAPSPSFTLPPPH